MFDYKELLRTVTGQLRRWRWSESSRIRRESRRNASAGNPQKKRAVSSPMIKACYLFYCFSFILHRSRQRSCGLVRPLNKSVGLCWFFFRAVLWWFRIRVWCNPNRPQYINYHLLAVYFFFLAMVKEIYYNDGVNWINVKKFVISEFKK